MLVELDVFSGRPNPTWEIDAAGVQALQRLHARLHVSEAPAHPPAALGYRGVRYALDAQAYCAVRGHIYGKGAVLDDPRSTVELFLLGLAPPEFAELRARIMAELSPGI